MSSSTILNFFRWFDSWWAAETTDSRWDRREKRHSRYALRRVCMPNDQELSRNPVLGAPTSLGPIIQMLWLDWMVWEDLLCRKSTWWIFLFFNMWCTEYIFLSGLYFYSKAKKRYESNAFFSPIIIYFGSFWVSKTWTKVSGIRKLLWKKYL